MRLMMASRGEVDDGRAKKRQGEILQKVGHQYNPFSQPPFLDRAGSFVRVTDISPDLRGLGACPVDYISSPHVL